MQLANYRPGIVDKLVLRDNPKLSYIEPGETFRILSKFTRFSFDSIFDKYYFTNSQSGNIYNFAYCSNDKFIIAADHTDQYYYMIFDHPIYKNEFVFEPNNTGFELKHFKLDFEIYSDQYDEELSYKEMNKTFLTAPEFKKTKEYKILKPVYDIIK